MEEHLVTLTKADIWMILGCIALSESEGTCFYDNRFDEELTPHVNWKTLEKKLKDILYEEDLR